MHTLLSFGFDPSIGTTKKALWVLRSRPERRLPDGLRGGRTRREGLLISLPAGRKNSPPSAGRDRDTGCRINAGWGEGADEPFPAWHPSF
jgi:hypothetical protein